MTMTVREVMEPTPITARPTIQEVARIMRDESIGAVLIAEGTELVGLVTDRDLVVRSLATGLGPETPVREVCSEQPWTVDPETEVVQAADLMRNAAVRRLPVASDGKAIGLISLGDIAALGAPDSVLGGISNAMPNTQTRDNAMTVGNRHVDRDVLEVLPCAARCHDRDRRIPEHGLGNARGRQCSAVSGRRLRDRTGLVDAAQ
ncbi:CBS domain-containing protein [Actinospica sp.]|uniref:CBS domain-containing protein n=1 Tax=Actinospica sp. TaxID=1872142 RepID=UPI002B65D3E3|nr:CBS domain-containing protein [Actinospica sp.]HWG26149.1 CBS domain-containing protein [Actinospica sp.]